MSEIDYSVIIRTIGKANEKYQKLLDSICALKPAPKEIIVVLPENYDLPAQRIGSEQFYYSKKGMSYQRACGINVCKTRYAFICDDDVEFESDFISKLYKPVSDGLCYISTGPLYSFFPKKGFQTFLSAVLSGAIPTLFHKNNYTTILNTTGYSYNRHLKKNRIYNSQSVAGTCFFADIEALKKVKFEDEVWLDDHGYAAIEDDVIIYKALLMGYNTCVVSDAFYIHNDAKTSQKNNSDAMMCSLSFNRVVFWHRFLYKNKKGPIKKIWSKICFKYHKTALLLFEFFSCVLVKKDKRNYIKMKQGYKEGYEFLKSENYKNLPDY